MKFVPILFLSIIQLVCYVEGWISFFLNCIVKFLSRILFLFFHYIFCMVATRYVMWIFMGWL